MRTLAESALVVGLVLSASTACHKPAAAEADGVLPAMAEAGAERVAEMEPPTPEAGPRIAESRCGPAEPGIVLDAAGAASDLELGDAIETPAGYAVSLLHRTPRGLAAAVAWVGAGSGASDAKGTHALIDLGPTLGDAPPPRILLAGSEVIAAAYSIAADAPAGNDKARRLSLYSVRDDATSGGAAKPIVDVPQQRDDSLAFDVALVGLAGATRAPSPAAAPAGRPSAVVVWDEASRAGHGVIRAAIVPLGDRTSPSSAPSPAVPAGDVSGRDVSGRDVSGHDVSPPESDAEDPRVVSYGAGSIVLWIARKPEPGVPTDAAEVEATGEARTFGWLESVVLDERGAPAGPVRKLTPSSGHVSAYDVRILPAARRPTLLVVARDDGESVDASGGELLRVRIVGDSVEPPVAFPSDGLGRGGPALVDGDPPWLVWIGPHEQMRLLPLDAEGAPAGKPSAEDEMSEARPLLFLRASGPGVARQGVSGPGISAPAVSGQVVSGVSRRVIVASPMDPAAQLRVFACAL